MRLMRSVGLSVETFGSGAEFLKSIDTRLPDCVVLDLCMPQMDGFSVQASLARKCAALPVIVLTGHDLPKARERAMQGGASAFLRKPVLDRTLLDAISAATSSAQPGGSQPQINSRSETPTEITISPSDRYRVRPNQQAIQTSIRQAEHP
jgi:FixJ family two-component response regulator